MTDAPRLAAALGVDGRHAVPLRDRGLGRRREVDLVGRLLHDSKAILADQLEQVARTSAERGFAHGDFDFALLTDGLRAEREQGITIDVAYRYFSTGAAVVHPRRLPGPRAVHAQHGHRRDDRRCRHRAHRRPQGRARADPAPPRRRRAAARAARHRRGEQDRPARLLGGCVRRASPTQVREVAARARHRGPACPPGLGARGRQHRRPLRRARPGTTARRCSSCSSRFPRSR